MFKFLSIIICVILFFSKASAEIVNEIKVLNNERISKETILIFSKIDFGNTERSKISTKSISYIFPFLL